MIFDQINEISFELNDGNNFDVFDLRSFAMLLKQEQKKILIAQLVKHCTSIPLRSGLQSHSGLTFATA